jgi:hypothetical protein
MRTIGALVLLLSVGGCAGSQAWLDKLPDGTGPSVAVTNHSKVPVCGITLQHPGETETREAKLTKPIAPGAHGEFALPAKKGQKFFAEAGPDVFKFDLTAYACKSPSAMERGDVLVRLDGARVDKEVVIE